MKRALVDQANSENIVLIEECKVSEPKTKLFHGIMNKIVPNAKKVLAIDDSFDDQFALAARNLPTARLGRAQDLGPLDIVQCDRIILSLKGLNILLAKFNMEATN